MKPDRYYAQDRRQAAVVCKEIDASGRDARTPRSLLCAERLGEFRLNQTVLVQILKVLGNRTEFVAPRLNINLVGKLFSKPPQDLVLRLPIGERNVCRVVHARVSREKLTNETSKLARLGLASYFARDAHV